MSAAITALTETCPACGGKPVRPLFTCGRGPSKMGCQVTDLVCPFCAGSGEVRRGRSSWAEIGLRLKRHREAKRVGLVEVQGQVVMTTYLPIEEWQPVPIDIEARHYRIPVELLVAIEAGWADPRIIAKHVGPGLW